MESRIATFSSLGAAEEFCDTFLGDDRYLVFDPIPRSYKSVAGKIVRNYFEVSITYLGE